MNHFAPHQTTWPERSLDPPDPQVCPEDCEHLVDGECQGCAPEDCPDYDDGHEIDEAYERARDFALEDSN
jgi:hypothetical protein